MQTRRRTRSSRRSYWQLSRERRASSSAIRLAARSGDASAPGAFLANRLACELSDRIAAIGAVSGVLGIDTCTPSRPMPVFHVHGSSDFVVPFGGGGVNGNISVENSIAGWATRNHCTGAATKTYDEGDATCMTRGGCDGNAEVVLCTIDGGGHQWPSGESTGFLNGALSDDRRNDLETTEAAWDFFVAHPR